MAESLAERLKRIAAEKKAAREAGQASPVVAPITEVTSDDRLEPVREEDNSGGEEPGITCSTPGNSATVGTESEVSGSPAGIERTVGEATGLAVQGSGEVEAGSGNSVSSSGSSSDHPLAMKFAELEETLLARDPQFKVILRDIHRHLGQDAELVTQMTEEEIAMVVTGLVLFANTEIVEVAKAKSVKKAVAEAKKKVISADDL